MKNFDWKKFGDWEIAVHCATQKEAIDFCNQSHEHGYDWYGGARREEVTFWETYKEETCYTTHEYSDKKFYEEEGYPIVQWGSYMVAPEIFTKSDLKDGDVILKRNGDVEIAIPSVGVFVGRNGFNDCDQKNEDLTSSLKSCFDIIEVRRPRDPCDCQFACFEKDFGEVVYNRERDTVPVVEMTLEEICEALGKKIKIVEG